MENGTSSGVVDSKMDSSITAVPFFLFDIHKIYFNMISPILEKAGSYH